MAKPLYVQEHERLQAYLRPPFMPPTERVKWELAPGEYEQIEQTLYHHFLRIENAGKWPSHLDEDPISLAHRFVQAAWWGRATKDSGYYKAMCDRYGSLLETK